MKQRREVSYLELSASNMALQRTRRPRLRSGRSLRSLGSPLNAYPLGRLPEGQMRARSISLMAIALIVNTICTTATLPGSEVVPTPRPFGVWLEDVSFIGVGSISQIRINAETGRAEFSVTHIEAWKGSAPSLVSFVDWPFGYSCLSEGQRVVFYAFHRRVTHSSRFSYVSPAPVVRIGGLDCFRFDYASQAVSPPGAIAVLYRGKAKELGLSPPVLLDSFRAAVKAIVASKTAA